MLILLACATPDAAPTHTGPDAPVDAPAAAPLPPHREFANVEAAIAAVLEHNPRVLGIGEVHATTDGPVVPTTMSRFTTRSCRSSRRGRPILVLETWHLDPACRKPAEHVATQVQADTKRPEETKDDLSELIDAAKEARRPTSRPRDRLRRVPEDPRRRRKRRLRHAALARDGEARGLRHARALDAGGVAGDYGGAVHNDVAPSGDPSAYSYGVTARQKGGDAYVELDLYVPELIRASPSLIEPAWAPLLDAAGPDHVLLYERGPGSFVLLLETTPGAAGGAGTGMDTPDARP